MYRQKERLIIQPSVQLNAATPTMCCAFHSNKARVMLSKLVLQPALTAHLGSQGKDTEEAR
jgi:hypothetical protein